MIYTLTSKSQYSKRCADGKSRNFQLFFINGIQILKQKIPFNEKREHGFDRDVAIYNTYVLGGYLHQTRSKWNGCSSDNDEVERDVKFPISKKILIELGVPDNLKIEMVDE